jgi:hypothetical protein
VIPVSLSPNAGRTHASPELRDTLPRRQAMAPSYTTIHICKYNGARRQRILDATADNYLSGFWGVQGPCPGIAHHNGWMGDVTNVCLPANSWVLSSDQIRLYRAQRGAVHRTTGSGGLSASSSAKWSINAGLYSVGEASNWACAALLHYNRQLKALTRCSRWRAGWTGCTRCRRRCRPHRHLPHPRRLRVSLHHSPKAAGLPVHVCPPRPTYVHLAGAATAVTAAKTFQV